MKDSLKTGIASRLLRSILKTWIVFYLMQISLQTGNAQGHFGFEIRPGLNFPIKDLADANLNIGIGLEGLFSCKIKTNLGLYTSWGWGTFKAIESFAGVETNFDETGYSMGLEHSGFLNRLKYNYVIRFGAIYNLLRIIDKQGNTVTSSKHALGWQIEIGTPFHLDHRWKIVPNLRFRSLNNDIEINSVTTPTALRYISGGIALAYVFNEQ